MFAVACGFYFIIKTSEEVRPGVYKTHVDACRNVRRLHSYASGMFRAYTAHSTAVLAHMKAYGGKAPLILNFCPR